MPEQASFFSIGQLHENRYELYTLEIIRERIRQHYYPENKQDHPLPNISINKERYELSNTYDPRFLVFFLIVRSQRNNDYPHTFIGYHGIYYINATTLQPTLMGEIISQDLSGEQKRESVGNIEFIPNERYMFMTFQNTVYKYKIIKKDENSQIDYAKQQGQIIHKNSNSSLYYFKRDPQYDLEIKQKIIIRQMYPHPFGKYLIGIGEDAEKNEYILKFFSDAASDYLLIKDTENCLDSSMMYERRMEFDPNREHRLVTLGKIHAVKEDTKKQQKVCLWNTEQNIKIINSLVFNSNETDQYRNIEGGPVRKIMQKGNVHMRYIKSSDKEGTQTVFKVIDNSLNIMNMLTVQNDTLVYDYSIPIPSSKSTTPFSETISIPDLNAEIYYIDEEYFFTSYRTIDNKVQSFETQFPLERQGFINEMFYDRDINKLCCIVNKHLNCFDVMINCKNPQKTQEQQLTLHECIQSCSQNLAFFNAVTSQCQACPQNSCKCQDGYEINHHSGVCSLNCELIKNAIPHSQFEKNTKCLCQQNYLFETAPPRCLSPNQQITGIPAVGVVFIVIGVLLLLIAGFFVLRHLWKIFKLKRGQDNQQMKQTQRGCNSEQSQQKQCPICKKFGVDCQGPCYHRYHFGCIRQKIEDDKEFECPECLKVFHNGLEDIKIIQQQEIYSIEEN